MKTKILILLIFFLPICVNSQVVTSVTPDTGSQGTTFPIVVHGSGTEWTLSPYFVVYFDSTGVETNSVVIVNDSTLSGNIIIDGKASTGLHSCIVVDQFFNFYYGTNLFNVFLNIPVSPTLFLPLNSSTNISQTPYFLWDSNTYVNHFRLQISSDSLFNTVVFDTLLANTPYTLRTGILNLNTKYFWRVNATNSKGTSPWSTIFRFTVRAIGITQINTEVPQNYKLYQNYPNPFNPVTKFKFSIPKESFVKLKIFDLSGKEISVVINQNMKLGVYEYSWNASNLPSGVYFYSLETESYREVRKAMLIK